jgi:hypothetical protein
MNKRILILLFVLFSTCICAVAQQQDDPWAKYVPRKLSELIKASKTDDLQQEPGVAIFTGSTTIKARMIYVGQSRPVPEDKKSLIKLWMQSNGFSEEHFQMLAEEFLFSEAGVEYWLPVQSVLIPHFKKEMRKGDSLDLFTAWIGVTFAEPGKRRPVFLVNEFEKVSKTRTKSRTPKQ